MLKMLYGFVRSRSRSRRRLVTKLINSINKTSAVVVRRFVVVVVISLCLIFIFFRRIDNNNNNNNKNKIEYSS